MDDFLNVFLLFIIFLLSSKIPLIYSDLNFKYLSSITLENKNIFVIEKNGVYICDPDFTKINKTVKLFETEEEKISTLDKLSSVILLKRTKYIISLINFKVYFFDTNGNYLYNTEKLIEDCTPTSISLVPLSYSMEYTEYILSYFDSNTKLNLLLYGYDFSKNESEFISKTIEDNLKFRKCNDTSCYYDPNDSVFEFKNQGLNCLFLAKYYDTTEKFIVCFFVASFGSNEYLEEMIFEIGNDDQIKLSTDFSHGYMTHQNIINIKADSNHDISLALVCIIISNDKPICYKFTLYSDYARFDAIESLIFDNECKSVLYGTKVTFLYEIENIVFSCLSDGDGAIQIGILDDNIEYIDNYIDYLFCSNIFGHSILYSNDDYIIISDMSCDEEDTPSDNNEIVLKSTEIIHQEEEYKLTSSIITSTENIRTSFISGTSNNYILNTSIISDTSNNAIIEKTSIISSTSNIDNNEKTSIILGTSYNIIIEKTSIISTSSNINNIEKTSIISGTSNNGIEKTSIMPDTNINIKSDKLLCPAECKTCFESNNEIVCTECNKENGYFPLSFSDNESIKNENCINKEKKEKKYPNFYLDRETEIYKPCYENCKTCEEKGDGENNNCLTCDSEYILKPDYEYTKNCVPKYKYLYYYNEFNQYIETETPNCPSEFPIKIKEKNKCIDKCSNDLNYTYTYNNICYLQCPENTYDENNNLICKDDPTKCLLTKDEIFIEDDSYINEEIKKIIEQYANEYNYTNNHISIINIGNYSVTLYKNKTCVSELSVSPIQIDLSSASSKVKKHYNISENEELIVGIVKNNLSNTESFEVYESHSGKPLNIFNICKDDTYSIEKSLLEELSTNSKVDFKDLEEMANQDINIIDLSDPFYNDICFHYKSKFDKDIPLKDRALIYYPNISLCEEGCELEAVFLQNWTTKCNCFFGENKVGIKDNAFYQSQFGEFEELISLANINVMKCYKDIFKMNFFKKSYGNFIILTIISVEIICSVINFIKSFFYIKKYIFIITKKFLKHLKKENGSLNIISFDINKEPNSPPHKTSNDNFNNSNQNNNENTNNNVIKKNKRKSRISSKNLEVFKPNNKLNEEMSTIKSKNHLGKKESNSKLIKLHNITLNNNTFNYKNNIPEDNLEIIFKEDLDINIEDFLKTDPDDMDYDDALRRDNRKFCNYYWDKIQSNQILINTFYYNEHLKPRTIKFILLALQIDLYFFVNGLFYNEEYVKKIFDLKKDTLYKKFLRFTDNLFYAFIVGIIMNYVIEFFFIEEKKLRVTLKREKDNILVLKYEMIQIIKDINKRYISFIIVCFVIGIFTWYHIYCFNNIYPHMQEEWLIFSILIIVSVQILSLLASLAETILRFLSFRFKSEKLFKLSLILS